MGHGLSYTTFAIAESQSDGTNAAATVQTLGVGETTTVKITVTNTGSREGDEVILALFIPQPGTVPPTAPAARLQQQMFGFERVSVAAGRSTELVFDVTPEMLQLFSADGDEMTYPGKYTLKFTNGIGGVVTKEVHVTTPGNVPMVRHKFV